MTYCLALRLDEGLVFLSDTRTNAGVDNISTYRKLHVFRPADDRVLVLQSAGNLATTREVLDRLGRDLAAGSDGGETLASVATLFEAALYVGRLSREVVARHRESLAAAGADGTATFLLGGQILGSPADVLLVYPEGNYIGASETRPFLQIGESKYGKYLLELGVRARVDLDGAVKVALGSMLSTARANLSVGPPYDLAVYRDGTLDLDEHRIEEDSEYLADLSRAWVDHMVAGIDVLPPVPWT